MFFLGIGFVKVTPVYTPQNIYLINVSNQLHLKQRGINVMGTLYKSKLIYKAPSTTCLGTFFYETEDISLSIWTSYPSGAPAITISRMQIFSTGS